MFIGLSALSAQIGLSKKQIYRLIDEGSIPYIRSKGKFFFNPEQVVEALNHLAAESIRTE